MPDPATQWNEIEEWIQAKPKRCRTLLRDAKSHVSLRNAVVYVSMVVHRELVRGFIRDGYQELPDPMPLHLQKDKSDDAD